MGTPQRTCLGCGKVRPQVELIRVAKTAEGKLIVDARRRAGGRGGYLCGAGCVEAAAKRKAWGRAFRSRVEVESEVLRRELAAVTETPPRPR